MKFTKIIIVFLILISFFCIPVSAVNQITNGDFETGDLTGWTYVSSCSVDSISAFEGNYGLNVQRTSGYGSVLTQSVNFTNCDVFSFDFRPVNMVINTRFHVCIDVFDYYPDLLYYNYNAGERPKSYANYEYDVSGLSGMHTIIIGIEAHSGLSTVYFDNFILDDGIVPPAEGNLYIANSAANQNWYINQSKYPDLDIYFQEILDYQIDNFNVSRDYYINCTTSNTSHLYTYNYFIDDNNGDSFDNSIYSRMGMETKILYPDSPTTYTFHLYEIEEHISDSFPWYFWILYPLYMLVEMFADDPSTTIVEIDTIDITLSKVSGDNETIPDIPEPPELPEIPEDIEEPEEPINWTVPDTPPTFNGSNQSINTTWAEGYYSNVNSTINGLCSPVYNFTAWSLSPVNSLNNSIVIFSVHMNTSFIEVSEESSILYESMNTIFNAIHPKIQNVITYYLIWLVLLLILKKR